MHSRMSSSVEPTGSLSSADRGHDLARRAVAALEAVVLDESRLHRMQLLAVRQPFDGGDLVAFVHHGEESGRSSRDGRSRAPCRRRTGRGRSPSCAGQMKPFAQGIQQGGARVHL